MDSNAHPACRALKAQDAPFDGRLVGVTSTAIYRRPLCRVRTPHFQNRRFFPTRDRADLLALAEPWRPWRRWGASRCR